MNVEQHMTGNIFRTMATLKQETLPLDEYKRMVHELTGEYLETNDVCQAKYTYLYLIQNAKVKGIYTLAIAKESAQLFIERFSWSFQEEEDESNDTKVDKKTGEVRKKKGWKKTEAVKIYQNKTESETRHDIIQKFMDQLDMTKQGATTYWYIAKAEAEKSG